MATQHVNITEADLHESKGVSTAVINSVYAANGAGSGVWRQAAQGSCYFENIATPYTLVFGVAGTFYKLAPTTTASGTGVSVTEGTNARLTYTGTATLSFNCHTSISLSTAAGANRDVRLAIYKNGVKVNGSVAISTTSSAIKQTMSIACDVSMATNDYLEVYAANDGASGDILIHTCNLMMDPQDS